MVAKVRPRKVSPFEAENSHIVFSVAAYYDVNMALTKKDEDFIRMVIRDALKEALLVLKKRLEDLHVLTPKQAVNS